MIQWLRPCALNAGSPGLIPGQGTRSHMLQRSSKILCAATKTLSSPKINTPQPQNPYPAFFCFLCIYIPLGNLLPLWDFFFCLKLFIWPCWIFIAVCRLLIAVVSPVGEPGLQGSWASAVVAPGL